QESKIAVCPAGWIDPEAQEFNLGSGGCSCAGEGSGVFDVHKRPKPPQPGDPSGLAACTCQAGYGYVYSLDNPCEKCPLGVAADGTCRLSCDVGEGYLCKAGAADTDVCWTCPKGSVANAQGLCKCPYGQVDNAGTCQACA